MGHKDEQAQEVEALESIFPEIEIIETDPFHALRFTLKSENYDDNPDDEAKIVLVFRFKEKYPDEIPDMEIEETENVKSEENVYEFLKQQASENLGMPMIYTLVFALIEKLNKDNEDRKVFEAEEKERKEREREAEELRKFEGTKVSVESFLKWKAVFDKEMQELKKQNAEAANKKLTGKQLFERDESLFNDIQLLANEDAVEVDESLFQNLDDLDLDDDEDDEYNPDEDDDDDDDDDEEEEEE